MTPQYLQKHIPDLSELLYFAGDISIALSRLQRGGLPFLERVLPDIADNIPMPAPYKVVIRDSSTNDRLIRQFVPEPVQRSLEDLAGELDPNSTQVVNVPIGLREKGNNHCHKYVLQRSGNETLFYLVDQEHDIGEFKPATPRVRNLLRPQIVNLFAVKLILGQSPRFAQLRYKTTGLPLELQKNQKKLEECAGDLVNHATPTFLADSEENIIYFFNVDEERTVLQARYVTPEQWALYAAGGNTPRVIQNQINSLQDLYAQGISAHRNYKR